MSGDSNIVWACLVMGMLLQLTYMVLPLQPWDFARYLGSAIMPIYVLASRTKFGHATVDATDGLFVCGTFTFIFAFVFQSRLLPRLGEGAILMWTTVLLCVMVEIDGWYSAITCLFLVTGIAVLIALVAQRNIPYVAKLGVYAWFLFVVIVMSVLQFRGSDFSLLMAGGSEYLDYRFALIDGAAGAYIGVHAIFLFEMLPIPGKGERWRDAKTRWTGYLDLVASRLDDQRLDVRVALFLVCGIATFVYANHEMGLLPDRTFANLLLCGVPIAWQVVCLIRRKGATELAPVSSTTNTASADSNLRGGIGRARHSKKHRQ